MSSDDISTPSKSYFKESCIGSWLVTVMPLRVGRGNGVWPFGMLVPTDVPTELRGLPLQLESNVGQYKWISKDLYYSQEWIPL